ncbi:MAG: GNAT family N-acetyltransferase [Actinomycetota bacterium]
MPESVVVRRAVEADLDALMALRRQVAGEGRWIGGELPLDEDGDRAMIRRGIDGPDAAQFVAELDGEIVGNIGMTLPRYRVADLGMLVAEQHRGRGIGSALLEAGIEWARAEGAHKVALQHWPHNEAAHALYLKHGFVQEGHLRRHYPRKNGEIWDAVVMGLLLDDPGGMIEG